MALGIEEVMVGCWTDEQHATGITVVLPPKGSLGAIAVRGGAPGTREAAALGPNGSGVECHAVALCGNSVFGLAAAEGVVQWCTENQRGLELASAIVPVVGAAVVFDISGPDDPRPGPEAGRTACEAATTTDPESGPVGVGRGCTVGKAAGRSHASQGGQGIAVARSNDLVVGAIVAVNAFGDVIDADGTVLVGSSAGSDTPRYPFVSLDEVAAWDSGEERANTTIGCLVTNATLTKPEACRVADLAHTGIARAIDPPHTSVDGDALFLLATQNVAATVDLVAHLASTAVAAAIRNAVQ
ncbi:MAG: peptidase S58 [Actinobacteria bacterium]|uniref:Peptidase S58 DmpA n=1 Tax=marine metagenome TaxID=408172 RepID=A0A381Q0W6_9ZZZZ|nr:peptidase S58 [Actinomycetota bacterium]MCS5689169.1 P1 family peptidase [Acidimicrobiales bacterium]|tara:strand:- start:7343 stop:8239 length:897 start_codon:yes stop_codon:yes gene_type:complete